MALSHVSVLYCSVAECVGDVFELMWSEKERKGKTSKISDCHKQSLCKTGVMEASEPNFY